MLSNIIIIPDSNAEEIQGIEPVELPSLPLREVLTIVVKRHPEILEAVENYKAIRAELGKARSGYKPTVTADAAFGPEYTNGTDTGDEGTTLFTTTANITAKQNLFAGFGTTEYVKETKARAMAASYEALDIANKVFLSTTEAYINVLKEAELVHLYGDNVLTQAQILEQIKEKADSGFGRVSDLYNSESRLALARANYISQQQNLNQALVRFHRQFGRLVKPIQFSVPEKTFHLPLSVQDVVDIAFRNHPAIEVAKNNIKVRKFSIKKSDASKYPVIDAELKGTHKNNTGGDKGDTNSASAFLKLNYTLYDGGKRAAEVEQAHMSMRKQYERLYIERRNLNEQVRLAWNIMQAERHKKSFLKDHVDMSLKTLESFKTEYYVGRRTLLELLDMENEHNEAKVAYITSKYNSMTAYYRLSQAMGALLHEYDTGILADVDLDKERFEFNMDDYPVLENNRDLDSVQDDFDQCDSSIEDSSTLPWGCIEDKAINVGYKIPENLAPYIVPKDEDGGSLTLDDEDELGEPEEELGEPEQVSLEIDETKDEQSFNLNNLHFKLNTAALVPESRDLMDSIADQLKQISGYNLTIIGHTDITGGTYFNKKLSERRAKAVKESLLRRGVENLPMVAYGVGHTEPIADNETLEGRKMNRRIEFKLIKQ
jgi:adhesin transport system outer membrane protein